LRVVGKDRAGHSISDVTVAVTPDGSGAYSVPVEFDPHVRTIDVSWPVAPAATVGSHAVNPGANSVGFSRTYDPGPAVLRLVGTAMVGGDVWPGDVELRV